VVSLINVRLSQLAFPFEAISVISNDRKKGFERLQSGLGAERLAPIHPARCELEQPQSMKSRAAIAGHPLHPIFVAIPIGLWSFAPLCDLIYLFGWGDASWKTAAFYCIGGGLLGAIPAIITGLIDFPIVEGAAARLIAKFHLALNSVVSLMFLTSFGLRFEEFKTTFGLVPVILSVAGAGVLGVSGWLGGELVSRFGVSVNRESPRESGN
jgi:uncharacterized membrane protein